LLLLLCSSLGWCLPLSSSLACLERNDERERRETIGQSMYPQKFVTTPLYRRVEPGQKCALLCDENNLTDPGSAISIWPRLLLLLGETEMATPYRGNPIGMHPRGLAW
jgi:hypothetical protein